MEAYELQQQADGEPPSDSDIATMLVEGQYEDILCEVLEWKGRVSPEYFERFHDIDPDQIKAAAQRLENRGYLSIRDVPAERLL